MVSATELFSRDATLTRISSDMHEFLEEYCLVMKHVCGKPAVVFCTLNISCCHLPGCVVLIATHWKSSHLIGRVCFGEHLQCYQIPHLIHRYNSKKCEFSYYLLCNFFQQYIMLRSPPASVKHWFNSCHCFSLCLVGANIFLTSSGLIKLGDFGCSVKLKNNTQTMPGEVNSTLGTAGKEACVRQ